MRLLLLYACYFPGLPTPPHFMFSNRRRRETTAAAADNWAKRGAEEEEEEKEERRWSDGGCADGRGRRRWRQSYNWTRETGWQRGREGEAGEEIPRHAHNARSIFPMPMHEYGSASLPRQLGSGMGAPGGG